MEPEAASDVKNLEKKKTKRKASKHSEEKVPVDSTVKGDDAATVDLPFEGLEKILSKDKLQQLDSLKLSQLKEAFSLFDFDQDGCINFDDLKFTFASMGNTDIPEEQLQQMLSEMPNPVDFDAFISLFGYKSTPMDPQEMLAAALSTWDVTGTGLIPKERIRSDLVKFGDRFTEKEAEYALEEAPLFDVDGVTMIDYVAFSNTICGLKNVMDTRKVQKEAEAKLSADRP